MPAARQADAVDQALHRVGVDADLVAVAHVVQDVARMRHADHGEDGGPGAQFVVGEHLHGLEDDGAQVAALAVAQALDDVGGHRAEDAGVAPFVHGVGARDLVADGLDAAVLGHGLEVVGDQGLAGAGNGEAGQAALPFRAALRQHAVAPADEVEVRVVQRRQAAHLVDVVAGHDGHAGVQGLVQQGLGHDVLQQRPVGAGRRGLDDVLAGRRDHVALDVDGLEVVDAPCVGQALVAQVLWRLHPCLVIAKRQQRGGEVLPGGVERQAAVIRQVLIHGRS